MYGNRFVNYKDTFSWDLLFYPVTKEKREKIVFWDFKYNTCVIWKCFKEYNLRNRNKVK